MSTALSPRVRTTPDPAGDCLAILLAGGRGSRLYELTADECKPAIPFGTGRIVDYVLSNVAEARLPRLMVATQYRPETLVRHLAGWAPRFAGGLTVRDGHEVTGTAAGYLGTADAVLRNLEEIDALAPKEVLVLSADHVYRMDLAAMIEAHRTSGVAATVAVTAVPRREGRSFGIATTDREGRVTAFDEKPDFPAPMPGRPDLALASMGIYVFDWAWLRAALLDDAARPDTRRDFGHDIMPRAMAQGSLMSYRLGSDAPDAYWRDVGTLDAYRLALLDLREGRVPRGRFTAPSPDWSHALCRSEGTVALPGATVPDSARLRNCIVGAGAHVPAFLTVGEDPAEDARWFRRTEGGTTLITAQMLAARQRSAPRKRGSAAVPLLGFSAETTPVYR